MPQLVNNKCIKNQMPQILNEKRLIVRIFCLSNLENLCHKRRYCEDKSFKVNRSFMLALFKLFGSLWLFSGKILIIINKTRSAIRIIQNRREWIMGHIFRQGGLMELII